MAPKLLLFLLLDAFLPLAKEFCEVMSIDSIWVPYGRPFYKLITFPWRSFIGYNIIKVLTIPISLSLASLKVVRNFLYTKALGHRCSYDLNIFAYQMNSNYNSSKRRSIPSDLFTREIKVKIYIQKTRSEYLDWNQFVPGNILTDWHTFNGWVK